MDQQQLQATLQAVLLQGMQQSGGAYSGFGAPHTATSVAPLPPQAAPPQAAPPQAPLPGSSAALPQAETYATTSYDPSAGDMSGVDSTYGSVTVPYTTTTASSSIMAAASGSGVITTTTDTSYTPYTAVDTVGGSDNGTNLANMTLPGGSTPIVAASRAMESPGYIHQFNLGNLNTSALGSSTLSTPSSTLQTPSHGGSLHTPTHDPRLGDVDVDNNGSRPPSGNGHNDGNDNNI